MGNAHERMFYGKCPMENDAYAGMSYRWRNVLWANVIWGRCYTQSKHNLAEMHQINYERF